MSEFRNCLDCVFTEHNLKAIDVKKELPYECGVNIEISLTELEGNCEMHMPDPKFELLLRDTPYVLGALKKANQMVIEGVRRREESDT